MHSVIWTIVSDINLMTMINWRKFSNETESFAVSLWQLSFSLNLFWKVTSILIHYFLESWSVICLMALVCEWSSCQVTGCLLLKICRSHILLFGSSESLNWGVHDIKTISRSRYLVNTLVLSTLLWYLLVLALCQSGSIGECGRSSQPSWHWGHYYCYIYLLTSR